MENCIRQEEIPKITSEEYHKQQADIGPHTQPMHFLPHYIYTKKEQTDDQLLPNTYPEILARKNDQIMTAEDFERSIKKNQCEYFNQLDCLQSKPAFDHDWTYAKKEDAPSSEDIQAMETFSTARIRESYANDLESYKIIYAWRELAEKPGTKSWKASLRVYVVGLFAPCAHTKHIVVSLEMKMRTHPDLPEWLKIYYKENPEDNLFDLSIYDRNSKLNCVGCSKGYKPMGKGKGSVLDHRVLIP